MSNRDTRLHAVLTAGEVERRRRVAKSTGVLPLVPLVPFLPGVTPPPAQPGRYDPYADAPNDNRRRPPRPWQRALPQEREDNSYKIERLLTTRTGDVAWLYASRKALADVDWAKLADSPTLGGVWEGGPTQQLRRDTPGWQNLAPSGEMRVFEDLVMALMNRLSVRLGARATKLSTIVQSDEYDPGGEPGGAIASRVDWHSDGGDHRLLIGGSKNALSTQFSDPVDGPTTGGTSEPGDAVLFQNARHREFHEWRQAGGQDRVLVHVSMQWEGNPSEERVRAALLKEW